MLIYVQYNNLGDGSHIRIIWSCFNGDKTHKQIYFINSLATSLPVAKALIEYNYKVGGKWKRKSERTNWYWVF